MNAPAQRRVLWLIKGLDVGGAERLLVYFANVADHDSFRYEAAFVLPGRAALVSELERAGVHVHCLGTDNHFDLRWALRLRKLLVQEGYDLLHMHSPYTAVVGTAVAASLPVRLRPRLVTTQHCMWKPMSPILRGGNRLVLRRSDAILAVSDMTAKSMPRALRLRTEVVVFGIPIGRVLGEVPDQQPVRDELGIRPEEVLITTVANFRPEKGHDILLAAARSLADEGLAVRFAVIGHGELEGQVRALRSELGLEDTVQLLGRRLDVVRILAESDIFVLPSLHEGFGVSLMEAIAAGVPVVATPVGGVPQAVADGVEGLIVPPGRPDLLAAALRRLVTRPEERAEMAVAARQRGESFDISVAVKRIEQIYGELIPG